MQTVHENRIYSLKITCGTSYPDAPPTVQFISRVNLPFVNQLNGGVDPHKLPVLANWNRNHSIETVLVEIRRYGLQLFHILSEADNGLLQGDGVRQQQETPATSGRQYFLGSMIGLAFIPPNVSLVPFSLASRIVSAFSVCNPPGIVIALLVIRPYHPNASAFADKTSANKSRVSRQVFQCSLDWH